MMADSNGLPVRPAQKAGKAVIWQAVQMGGVKLVSLLRIVVLARLLSPADFGLIAIATTAMGFLLNLTNFGMVPALVQGEQVDEAQYDAAWTVGVTRSLLIAVVMIVTAPLIANIFAEPNSVTIIRFVAITPFLEALSSIKLAELNRNLLFKPLTLLRIADVSVDAVVSIVVAISFGVWGPVAGMLAGAAVAAIGSYFLAPHQPRLVFKRDAIRPLIHFGRWIFITSLIVMAGSYVLRIVISRQLGVAGLGLYYLAAQLAFIPAEVASQVVGNVAFPLFARLQNDIVQAGRVFRAIFTSLAGLLFPVCALIFVLAPGLTSDLLGPNWEGTEPVIRVLALVSMIGLFGEAVVPLLKGYGKPDWLTLIELVQSILIISLAWVLTEQFGLVGAALSWLPAVTVSQFLSAYFIRQILYQPFSGLRRPIVAVLFITVLSGAIAGVTYYLAPGLAGIVVGCALAALAAATLLWVFDRRFDLGFIRNLVWVFPQVATLIRLPSAD